MLYTIAKAIHVVGFISWFAGLFYVVRLFVYHAEANECPEAEREILQRQYVLMAGRLWKIITVPAMVVTILAGATMVSELEGIAMWLRIKLVLLVVLVGYHHACGRIRRAQAAGRSKLTGAKLRIFNEVATMLMVAIVFIAVLRNALDAAWAVGAWVALGIVLMLALRLYRRSREAPKPDAGPSAKPSTANEERA